MSKTYLRFSIVGSCLLGLAVFASGAQARGFHGGGFGGHGGGHGIAVGERHPGMNHRHHDGGHWHGRGHWHGWGWQGVGYPVYDGCTVRRTVDVFGRIVLRRFCD